MRSGGNGFRCVVVAAPWSGQAVRALILARLCANTRVHTISATLRGESGGYAVAIMATIGAGALIGYLYSIMLDRFDTPKFVITPAACWASWVPSGQGSASMS
jgi:hypothetical protein